MLDRSHLEEIVTGSRFLWATGIEDTFITDPWPQSGRILDEYELTGHYQRCSADVGLMASLGVEIARYGIPWHRINPAPDRWDWEWTDGALNRILGAGIQPIVDLVHYGLPGWLEGAFLNPEYPARVADFARRVAERFHGRIRWFTPLNEPRITAWYCGRLGWWPPYRRGWRGFVAVTLAVCRGMVLTARALRGVDPGVVLVHADPADVYASDDPGLQAEVAFRQQIGFLALDLVLGKVGVGHPLYGWLLRHGATPADLEWFQSDPIGLDIVGLNLYPMFSQKRVVRAGGSLRLRMPYGSGELVEQLAQLYWNQYRLPLMITETATRGSVKRRLEWLEASVQAMRRLRGRGIPLVGYTWWPMFSLVAWAYRQGTHPVSYYLEQMGLWDLDSGPESNLARRSTPLVGAYQALVSGGTEAVGPLFTGAPTER